MLNKLNREVQLTLEGARDLVNLLVCTFTLIQTSTIMAHNQRGMKTHHSKYRCYCYMLATDMQKEQYSGLLDVS